MRLHPFTFNINNMSSLEEEIILYKSHIVPKGSQLHQEKFPVKTKSNLSNEHASYGSLRVFVRTNGAPFTSPKAKAERTFLINQGVIDDTWEVIPWGTGFAVAPITNLLKDEE